MTTLFAVVHVDLQWAGACDCTAVEPHMKLVPARRVYLNPRRASKLVVEVKTKRIEQMLMRISDLDIDAQLRFIHTWPITHMRNKSTAVPLMGRPDGLTLGRKSP